MNLLVLAALLAASTQDDWNAYRCGSPEGPHEMRKADCAAIAALRESNETCGRELWRIRRRTDSMTDVKFCNVGPNDDAILTDDLGPLFVWDGTGWEVGAMGHDYPGANQYFRIDSNPPLAAGKRFTGSSAAELVAQARAGKSLLIRYSTWPRKVPREVRVQVCDLPAKLAECESE